jgi:regulatory protein
LSKAEEETINFMNRDFGTKLLIFSYSRRRISQGEYLHPNCAFRVKTGLKMYFKTGNRASVDLYLKQMAFPGSILRTGRVSREGALQKLKHYCGYQERSHSEAKQKLYALGLFKKEVEELLSDLIQEGYLNEERFAIQFASGKFRIKGWGKQKILQGLKQKGVSPYCIRKALDGIDQEEYQKSFRKQADKKWSSLRSESNIFVKKTKWRNYLLQKGFESSLIKASPIPGSRESGARAD